MEKRGYGSLEIELARANSASENSAMATNRSWNAQAIADFSAKGLTLKQSSYSQDCKDQIAHSVDSDGDQLISRSELHAQIGGNVPEVAVLKLYAALDVDGDGSLSMHEIIACPTPASYRPGNSRDASPMTLVILPSAHCVFSGGRKWNIAASTCEATMHSRAYLGTKENPLRTFGARLRLSRARQL